MGRSCRSLALVLQLATALVDKRCMSIYRGGAEARRRGERRGSRRTIHVGFGDSATSFSAILRVLRASALHRPGLDFGAGFRIAPVPRTCPCIKPRTGRAVLAQRAFPRSPTSGEGLIDRILHAVKRTSYPVNPVILSKRTRVARPSGTLLVGAKARRVRELPLARRAVSDQPVSHRIRST